jgi:alpha-tubulin suppressor-like RCC1 family protein
MIRMLAIAVATAACGRVAFDPLADAPRTVVTGLRFAAGRLHNCALDRNDMVACWGANDVAQLGDGNAPNDQLLPSSVAISAVGVAAGEHHSCALAADGTAECWGENANGQLGTGDITNHALPFPISGPSEVVELVTGNFHTCVRTRSGTVFCTGESGAFGGGGDRLTLTKIPGISDAVQLTAGSVITCARRATGEVACWGSNAFGALGRPGPSSGVAVAVEGLTDAIEVIAGNNHVCALRVTGQVMCWGRNRDGNLGDGMQIDRDTPVEVIGISGAVEIEAGDFVSCARLGPSDLRCWGANTSNQLGNTSADPMRSFTPVSVIGLPEVVSFQCGGAHMCAIATTGEPWCWGNDSRGQLGTGPGPTSRVTPLPVIGFP